MTIEEEIVQRLSGGWDEADARDVAKCLMPLLNRVRAEAWHEGHTQALANIAWPKERKANPYIEQNSEGNET